MWRTVGSVSNLTWLINFVSETDFICGCSLCECRKSLPVVRQRFVCRSSNSLARWNDVCWVIINTHNRFQFNINRSWLKGKTLNRPFVNYVTSRSDKNCATIFGQCHHKPPEAKHHTFGLNYENATKSIHQKFIIVVWWCIVQMLILHKMERRRSQLDVRGGNPTNQPTWPAWVKPILQSSTVVKANATLQAQSIKLLESKRI